MAETFTPDRDLIDRFLQNRASAREEARLEVWLLENPGTAESLGYDIALRRGVQRGEAPEVLRRAAATGWRDVLSLLTPRFFVPAALAVLVLLALPVTLIVRQAGEIDLLQSRLSASSQPAAARVFTLAANRSSAEVPQWPVSQAGTSVVLGVVLDYLASGRYTATLTLDGAETVTLTDLEPDAGDTVHVLIPSVREGRYHLVLTSQETGEATRYQFDVVVAPD